MNSTSSSGSVSVVYAGMCDDSTKHVLPIYLINGFLSMQIGSAPASSKHYDSLLLIRIAAILNLLSVFDREKGRKFAKMDYQISH